MIKSLLLAGSLSLLALVPASASTPGDTAAPAGDCETCVTAAPMRLAQLTLPGGAVGRPNIPREEAGQGVVNVCCPPIATQGNFAAMFRIHQLPGKSIADTYGLTFMPTTALDTQMKAFAPFAGLFTPNGWVPNSVLLDAEMKQLNVPATWSPSSAGVVAAAFNPGTPVFRHALRGYWANPGSGIWNGPHNDFGNHAWEVQFEDGKHVSPSHMQPNKWYVIKLTLQLASKDRPEGPSWHVTPINCMTRYVAVRVQSAGFKVAPGSPIPPGAAQIVSIN